MKPSKKSADSAACAAAKEYGTAYDSGGVNLEPDQGDFKSGFIAGVAWAIKNKQQLEKGPIV